MKTFVILRDVDETNVSGTGFVGWAVEFPHGLTVVTFRDDVGPRVRSAAVYQTLAEADRVHGHGGKTRFVEIDVPFTNGHSCAVQDACKNVPLASVGYAKDGVLVLPNYVQNLSPAYAALWSAGYQSAARSMHGQNWRPAAKPTP